MPVILPTMQSIYGLDETGGALVDEIRYDRVKSEAVALVNKEAESRCGGTTPSFVTKKYLGDIN